MIVYHEIDKNTWHAVIDNETVYLLHRSAVWNNNWAAITFKTMKPILENPNMQDLRTELEAWHRANGPL